MGITPKRVSWRASQSFTVATVAIGCFGHLYLSTFIVPILPYMLEVRMNLDPSQIQAMTSAILATYAFTELIASPVIGHYADKISSRKIPLLVGLCIELVATVAVATTRNLPLFFFARLLQAISGMVLWIVGCATMADIVGTENMGKATGITTAAVSAGSLAGPMMAGILVETVGYWQAWSLSILVLVVDLVMRLMMIENPRPRPITLATSENTDKSVDFTSREGSSDSDTSAADDCHEQTNLLPPRIREVKEQKGIHFYICLSRHPRFLTAQYSYMLYSLLLASLEATLPLHVQSTFGWGSFGAGMMFLALQAPGIVLSPIVGWLRDRVGTRHPTWIAFAVLTPDIWLLGTPGDARFPWAMGERGWAVYTASVIFIGVFSNLLNGVGMMESKHVVDELETSNPGIFGPHGGYSRVCATSSMSWSVGMLLGPIISGCKSSLQERGVAV
ncbi:hypothetical protein MMC22_000238 [Lobaria immixta]|nr:hypothetical protein [Lobaria immixta]